MEDKDREDLLVLSSGSENDGAYEYLSEDDVPEGGRRVRGHRQVKGGGASRQQQAEQRVEHIERSGTSMSNDTAVSTAGSSSALVAVGTRKALRPLSAGADKGVSFTSPSHGVPRPQSAPAVRQQLSLGAKGGGQGGYVARLRVRREEEGDWEEGLDEEVAEPAPAAPPSSGAGRGGGGGWNTRSGGEGKAARPVDSGQRRIQVGSPGSVLPGGVPLVGGVGRLDFCVDAVVDPTPHSPKTHA